MDLHPLRPRTAADGPSNTAGHWLLEAHLERATASAGVGRVEAALADLNTVLAADPNHFRALKLRGSLFFILGKSAKAVEDFTLALGQQPEDVELLLKRAAAYFQMGDHLQALADRESAVGLQPAMAEPRVARAASYHHAGDHEKGFADQAEAIRVNPTLALAWLARASSYVELGKLEEAAADLRQALTADPEYPLAKQLLARVQASIERGSHLAASRGSPAPQPSQPAAESVPAVTSEPAPTAEKAVLPAIPPRAPDAAAAYRLLERGRALTTAGRLEEAIAVLDEALRANPENARTLNAHGFVNLRLRRLEAAIADFGAAIELDPKSEAPF